MKFKDRKEAGYLLSKEIKKLNLEEIQLLAIPRGGVPVAFEISKQLACPMSLWLAKKIGHPTNSEFAIGAVSKDSVILNENSGVSKEYIENKINELKKEIEIKRKRFNLLEKRISLEGKNLILVDDGIATGNSMLACIQSLMKEQPAKLFVAIPVAPARAIKKIKELVDGIICLHEAEIFFGVGAFYDDFSQVSDEEVIACLKEIQSSHFEIKNEVIIK